MDAALAFVLAFVIAMVTVPVGVSGAVFLLPVQLGVLHAPSPAVTPTNLLYNVIATPGALLRYRSAGRLGGPLLRLMVWGTLPGVVVGAVLRITVASGPQVFRLLLAALMLPLGVWLLVGRDPRTSRVRTGAGELAPARVAGLALVVGVVGGIYGVGGGSILAPVLVALGLDVVVVAPAALASTFLTSLVGVMTYAVLAAGGAPGARPDWATGVLLGVAGLLGGYLGAGLQGRLPVSLLRRLLGALALALAVGYVVTALG
jgi:uncharacterized membrane protein YfcA